MERPYSKYFLVGYGELESFNKLSQKISNIGKKLASQYNVYFTFPPLPKFSSRFGNLGTSGLAKDPSSSSPQRYY